MCGKCRSVLLERVDRLFMQNGAIKCNSCGTYNSLEKINPYAKPPLTLRDIPDIEEPAKHFSMSGLWQKHPLAPKFIKVSDELLNAWNAEQTLRPNVLYHYTNFNGLTGILSTERVWQTDIAYLNDASEMQIGIDLIENSFEAQKKGLGDSASELLRRASVTTSPMDTSQGFYVACFCRNGDLLSQWRAYGAGGGGYALGFNAKQISRSGKIQIRKVIYERNKQVALIENTVKKVLAFFDEAVGNRSIKDLDADQTLPAFASFLSDHLSEFLFCFKHEAFKEEDEWRAISRFNRTEQCKKLQFRGNQGFPVPYIESYLADAEHKMPKLPLVEIVHGPTLHPQLTKKALNLLLEKHDYEFVELRGSNAPLRA